MDTAPRVDHVWNHAVRHLFRAPELGANRARRHHAFKLATCWLGGVALVLAAGATSAGLVLGGVLVADCSVVTVTNFCIPSTMPAWLDARRRKEAIA